MSENALEVVDLSAGYGGRVIVESLSLTVASSEIVVLIGPNGSGKSTALKGMIGAVPYRRGSVRVFGRESISRGPASLARLGMCYVPQGGRVFSSLSTHENLLLVTNGADRRQGPHDIERVYRLFPALRERARIAAGLLSAGERQMLALARGFILGRRILLVDEPTSGLAPPIGQAVLSALASMRSEDNRTLIVVEQNTANALALADRVYGIRHGQLCLSGVLPSSVTTDILRSLYI